MISATDMTNYHGHSAYTCGSVFHFRIKVKYSTVFQVYILLFRPRQYLNIVYSQYLSPSCASVLTTYSVKLVTIIIKKSSMLSCIWVDGWMDGGSQTKRVLLCVPWGPVSRWLIGKYPPPLPPPSCLSCNTEGLLFLSVCPCYGLWSLSYRTRPAFNALHFWHWVSCCVPF